MDAVLRALRPLSQPPSAPGWNHEQMRELLGDGERTPAAVLIGLRGEDDPHLVFTLRTANLSAHAGQVSFPGGRSDPEDADAVATALRESEEEIGLAPELVTPLGFLDCFETVSGYCVTPVVARIAADAHFEPAPDEVAEVFEVPFSFFLEPQNMQRHMVTYRGHQREMVEFGHNGYRIWGVTAAILYNLLQRMKHA